MLRRLLIFICHQAGWRAIYNSANVKVTNVKLNQLVCLHFSLLFVSFPNSHNIRVDENCELTFNRFMYKKQWHYSFNKFYSFLLTKIKTANQYSLFSKFHKSCFDFCLIITIFSFHFLLIHILFEENIFVLLEIVFHLREYE